MYATVQNVYLKINRGKKKKKGSISDGEYKRTIPQREKALVMGQRENESQKDCRMF